MEALFKVDEVIVSIGWIRKGAEFLSQSVKMYNRFISMSRDFIRKNIFDMNQILSEGQAG